MSRLKSLTGVLHMPEIKVNFHVTFDEQMPESEEAKNAGEEEPEGEEARKIGRVLDQFSNLSPQMQEIIVEFAEFLEKKGGKSSGQDPTT
jgi:hypothetical protein